jgi:hypothetical protein
MRVGFLLFEFLDELAGMQAWLAREKDMLKP